MNVRHLFQVVIVLIVMAALLTGCGGGAATPAAKVEPTRAAEPTKAPDKPTAEPTKAPEPTQPAAAPTEAPAPAAGALTGLAAYKLAAPEAAKWQSDAVLIQVGVAGAALFESDGTIKPTMWAVQFYSPSAKALYTVNVVNGAPQPGTPVDSPMTDDRSVPDPTSLIDSDKALSIAEQNGGADARKGGEIAQLQLSLVNDGQGNLKWVANYTAKDYMVKYTVHVDAKTGKVLLATAL